MLFVFITNNHEQSSQPSSFPNRKNREKIERGRTQRREPHMQNQIVLAHLPMVFPPSRLKSQP